MVQLEFLVSELLTLLSLASEALGLQRQSIMTDLNVGSGVQTQALELEQQHFCSRDTSTVPYLLIFIMNFF